MTRTRRAATALAAATLLTLAAACGSDSDDDAGPGPATNAADSSPDAEATDPGPGTEALRFGQTHTFDGLDVTAELTEVFSPNEYADLDDTAPYALITLTVFNTGDADPDAASAPLHQCQLDGTPVTHEQFDSITDDAPALIETGYFSTWRAAACPVTTPAGERGTTLEYGVALGGGTTVWFSGEIPAD